MENLTPNLHYATWLDGNASKACVDVRKLAEDLPHGSGYDGDWYLTVRKNGTVVLDVEYHGMDENGYYNGWRTLHASISRLAKPQIHDLGTPGFYQELYPVGAIVLKVRSGGDLGDYLYETLTHSLSEILTPMESGSFKGPNGKTAFYSRETGGWQESA